MKQTKQNPETITIHSGTNDLKTNSSPNEIARDIINLTTFCRTKKNKTTISAKRQHGKTNVLRKNVKPEMFVLLTTKIFLESINVAEVGYIEIVVERRN